MSAEPDGGTTRRPAAPRLAATTTFELSSLAMSIEARSNHPRNTSTNAAPIVSGEPEPTHRRDKRRKKAAFHRMAATPTRSIQIENGLLRERRRQRLSDVERYARAPSVTRIALAPRTDPSDRVELIEEAMALRPDLAARFTLLVRRARRGDAYAARTVLDEARHVLRDPSVAPARLVVAGSPSWRAAAHRMVEFLQRAYELRARSRTGDAPTDAATRADQRRDMMDPTVLSFVASALACLQRTNGKQTKTAREIARVMLARAYTERGSRMDSARGSAANLAADLLEISRTTLYVRLEGYDDALATAIAAFAR